jgi:hypothetical protein
MSLMAQEMTKVRGKVMDANTGEPIPFAAVSFKGKNIGTTTDFDGNFFIETLFASNTIVVSSLGYEPAEFPITLNSNNFNLNIRLISNEIQLDEVSIVSERKKVKYKNKGNPAVMLIREVIKHRDDNRISHLESYSIDRYRKIGLDINNITDRFKKNPVFNNLQSMFDYVDTSEINGKPFLPVYINEQIATIYEQKNPHKFKEVVSAEHSVGFEEIIDGEGVASMMGVVYKEVDIYDGSISFLSKDFVSPIANIAPSVYRYYILDTVMIGETQTVMMGFIPRNDAANAFKGKIWITLDEDSTYAVKKAELGKMDQMNLNWVNTFLIELNFEKFEGIGMFLTESHSTIDFNVASSAVGAGIYGKSSFYYQNLQSNIVIPDSILHHGEEKIYENGYATKDSLFWVDNRYTQLTASENQIKIMSDHVQSLPAFKTFHNILKLLMDGYWDFGPVGIGPFGGVYSFNQIEGFRMSLGLRTTEKLSYHWETEAYGAYGFKDEVWKYGIRGRYYWNRDRRRYLNINYQRDYEFPGSGSSLRGDNFLISFQRGVIDKMIDFHKVDLDFSWEVGEDLRTNLLAKVSKQSGLGTLYFIQDQSGETRTIENFETWELGFKQRWAPNQEYYQGDYGRVQITTKHPIYEFTYTYGQSYDPSYQFNYNKLNLRFYKRNTWGILGYNDLFIEGEKTFGQGVPFLYMRMHTANQTYAFSEYGANMMNYLEFVSDQYVYLIFTHYFDGLFLNQVPLLKRLKWRSLVSGRMIYGSVTDDNDPTQTDGLVQFPTDIDGNATTFTLDNKPYIEASIGIENIFNLIRIDLVKRFTYLDNPNIPNVAGVKGLGLRFRFRFNF